MRRGEAAAEDRPHDGLRVAGAVAEGPGDALEASATAFNKRGGANGSCIEVTTCDDGGNVDQAVACVRTIDNAGVVATVNDQGTAGQADVSDSHGDGEDPPDRVQRHPGRLGRSERVPARRLRHRRDVPAARRRSSTRTSTRSALIRVDLAAASALSGSSSRSTKATATFPYDVPVPGGTTDFSQFILGAQNAGADGVTLALGEQEADPGGAGRPAARHRPRIGVEPRTFSHEHDRRLGDFAKQMVFLWSFPPATVDLPVYKALRADLAASGEEALQPENLKASPMRSWIGLYALL